MTGLPLHEARGAGRSSLQAPPAGGRVCQQAHGTHARLSSAAALLPAAPQCSRRPAARCASALAPPCWPLPYRWVHLDGQRYNIPTRVSGELLHSQTSQTARHSSRQAVRSRQAGNADRMGMPARAPRAAEPGMGLLPCRPSSARDRLQGSGHGRPAPLTCRCRPLA